MAGQRLYSILEVDSAAFRDGLREALEGLKVNSRKELATVGAKVRDRARALCPVDTGWLKSSISFRTGEDNTGPFIEVGVLDVPANPKAMKRIASKYIGQAARGQKLSHVSPNEYGYYVEFGTIKMGAQPFLRPALAEVTGFSAGTISGPRQKHEAPKTFTVAGAGG
jgi:HK97 gp10 family phage protein